jgi:putative nucleotidyltransferase with HDIG domain
MLIDPVREFARTAYRDHPGAYGSTFFDHHVATVVRCSRRLACQLEADPELAEAAAYLHDISVAFRPDDIQDHARLSAQLAQRELMKWGWDADAAGRVAEAIAVHSNPLPLGAASPEAVCLSNADCAARILEPAYWLYYAYVVRGMPFDDGRRWLNSLIHRQWEILIEPARNLARESYETCVRIFDPGDES